MEADSERGTRRRKRGGGGGGREKRSKRRTRRRRRRRRRSIRSTIRRTTGNEAPRKRWQMGGRMVEKRAEDMTKEDKVLVRKRQKLNERRALGRRQTTATPLRRATGSAQTQTGFPLGVFSNHFSLKPIGCFFDFFSKKPKRANTLA
jgi:hypothetical protein